jgi:TolA-binding protein
MIRLLNLAAPKTIMRYCLSVAACTLLFALLPSCSQPSPHAEALKEMTAAIEETTAVLKSINSVDDARTAQTQLTKLSQRALDIQKKMNSLIGTKIPLEAQRYTAEKLEENNVAFRRLMEEASRLQQRNPEALRIIAPSLRGFQSN